MSSDREKKVEEIANFIINNISLASSINLLIQDARKTAEIIVDNNYEKEDFEIYLSKSIDIPVERKKREKRSSLKRMWVWAKNKIPYFKNKRTGFSTKR